MVIRPKEYSKEFIDTDLDHYNIGLTKKKRITQLRDVSFAHTVGEHLRKVLKLDLDVCHELKEDIAGNDYLFSGEGWLDPGDVVKWQRVLSTEIHH
jgi:hypothetical protein